MVTKRSKKSVRSAKDPVTTRSTGASPSLEDVRRVVREEVEQCFKLHSARNKWRPISEAPRNKWILTSGGPVFGTLERDPSVVVQGGVRHMLGRRLLHGCQVVYGVVISTGWTVIGSQ